MSSAPRALLPGRSLALLIVLALAPLWLVGMFDRGLWTPDEPREADIVWRMSWQHDRTLPQLAGTPFLEKPPLSYWMSGAAVALFGDSATAARTPNLLYALIVALAIATLALAMRIDVLAAVIAALVAASALTAYRVGIWLAPDACLLAGNTVALLGAWRGYQASGSRDKLLGYTLMHLGAAIGFMAKSGPGWLVPGLALLTIIAWERRWSELLRWQLYAGFILQALIIGPWVWAVSLGAHGPEALRTLFWNNLVGRFTRIAAPAALDYASGHRNTPGKYFLELPLYLLPWTLVVAAALRRAWTQVRLPEASAWRFAIAASLPLLVLLSLAATARDVYAAPALLGFALLTGLWVSAAQRAPAHLDQLAIRFTRYLVLLIALVLCGALLTFAAAGEVSWLAGAAAALVVFLAAATALAVAARAQRRGNLEHCLAWTYAGYAAALCLSAACLFPIIDRWQDLPQIARRIHTDTAQGTLALLDPDETTIGVLDRISGMPLTILTSSADTRAQVVSDWFKAHGRGARVLVLLPDHAPGPVTRLLAGVHAFGPPADGEAARLVDAGVATLIKRYELPQGRRYALLAPPSIS